MTIYGIIILLLILVCMSAIVSSAEIALTSAQKFRLKILENNGDIRAQKVIQIQKNPGEFITAIQICLNAIAILAGIVGEGALTPFLNTLIPNELHYLTSPFSFSIVTIIFVIFADLIPKKLAINTPEIIAVRIINLMKFIIFILKPLIFLFNQISDLFLKLFNIPTHTPSYLTYEEIHEVMNEGAESGAIKKQEHRLIENIFDIQDRTITATMTPRDNIIFFDSNETQEEMLKKIIQSPHSNFLVCNHQLENVLGYVESKSLLPKLLQKKEINILDDSLLNKVLIIPDTLSLYEVLELFKNTGEDFSVIINEYALVVGIITLKDIMNIFMRDFIYSEDDVQIIQRDENSWLIDGMTPLNDVIKALNIETFPNAENYETIGGFMMYMLRKVPKKTDFVFWDKYKFEVIDTEGFKIDQLLVSLLSENKN